MEPDNLTRYFQEKNLPNSPIHVSRSHDDLSTSKVTLGLAPLNQKSETDFAPIMPPNLQQNSGGLHPPDAPNLTTAFHHCEGSSEARMMDATISDVQQALQQLGRDREAAEDEDSVRRPSFASILSGGEINTERENNAYVVDSHEGWHNDARRRLLETVRREVEKQEFHVPGQPAQEPQSNALSAQLIPAEHQREKKQPSEWTVDEVVEWLECKGFDGDVQHKFIEQDITGDVLLELNINLLKSEIDIAAFGKRVKIANAISALRQTMSSPPSHTILQEGSLPQGSFQSQQCESSIPAQHGHHVLQPALSRDRLSAKSVPGGLQPTPSLPPSPTAVQEPGQQNASVNGQNIHHGSNKCASVSGSGSTRSMQGAATTGNTSVEERVGLGLLVQDDKGKTKDLTSVYHPAYLSLAPSTETLSETVKAVNRDEDEDPEHTSETDTAIRRIHRKLFSFSQGTLSPDSGSRHSSTSTQASPRLGEKGGETTRNQSLHRRSMEAARAGAERLSLLGATFTSSLGKGRKEPPGYPANDNERSLLPAALSSSSVGHKPSGTLNESTRFAKKDDKTWKGGERRRKVLRKRTSTLPGYAPIASGKSKEEHGAVVAPGFPLKQGESILDQIGEPDHAGWMRKRGERYNTWRARYFVLSGQHLYWLRNNSKIETNIKGYVNIMGYKITADENVDPGKYGFRIEHDTGKVYYFSSDDKGAIRDWMKAIMKATIGRDYTLPVTSSCNIHTISLSVAQTMDPAPRPPSPCALPATLKPHQTEEMGVLETVGMKVPNEVPHDAAHTSPRSSEERDGTSVNVGMMRDIDDESVLTTLSPKVTESSGPTRPPRAAGRHGIGEISAHLDLAMLEWANPHLPADLRVSNPFKQIYSALALFRLAESISGRPVSPPVPDSAFPSGSSDDGPTEGLFALFDFLVNNEVKLGSVSINDVKLQRPEKVAQIVKALKSWDDTKNQ